MQMAIINTFIIFLMMFDLKVAQTLSSEHEQSTTGQVSAYLITDSSRFFSGRYASGTIRDIMIENERVALVISDIGHTIRANSGGNIIDAGSVTNRIDALEEFYTYFDDDYPRQAEYNSITIINNGEDGGPAVVRASGVDSQDSSLVVITEYSLEADKDFLLISTTVTNTGNNVYTEFELGDVFAWGDCQKYAPGYGTALKRNSREPWISGASPFVSYGYFSPDTNMLWGPNGSYWSNMNVKIVNLIPGESGNYSRYFLVGGGDVASVATLIQEVMAIPVGSFHGSVSLQQNSEPVSGALIDVYDSLYIPYLQMVTDSTGVAASTLPPGEWQMVALSLGYDTTGIKLSISTDSLTSFDFRLKEDRNIVPTGDTLTMIQRPLINIPAIVRSGDILIIECEADHDISEWTSNLVYNQIKTTMKILSALYDSTTKWWSISARVPDVPVNELYDLVVTADGVIEDISMNAVHIIPEFKDDYYFIHITDTHLPTNLYYNQSGSYSDTSEMLDLHEVIDDINIINPEFVLHTGDLINEGELEDFQKRRYYTRAQRIFNDFNVPLYLVAGNHDIGGWSSTPPPDGTARRLWWKFFGWKRLSEPPPGAPWYTQNYSFDYGPVHYIGLESYDNYDRWRSDIYGRYSFTPGQMQWMADDIASASESTAQVLFYHNDFSKQIDLNALGVDLALWGHIHQDSSDSDMPPYNISTNAVSNNRRSYRLIRVSNGTIKPSLTLSAGPEGDSLNVKFLPANNGSHFKVSAQITNQFEQRFEHAQIRFAMPQDVSQAQITGGKLNQVYYSAEKAIYYIDVDIQPNSSHTVTIALETE